MRKVITGAFVSMDGVMQAPGGPEEDPSGGFRFGGWVAPHGDDPVFGEELGKLFGQPYDLLLGRRTYEIFAAYWPYYGENGPDGSIATQFNRARKYVATRSGDVDTTWKGTVVLRDAATDVAKLKKEDGPSLLTQGSGDLIQTLLAHDLIDEIHVLTFPVLLGRGKKLFRDGAHPGTYEVTSSRVSPKGLIVTSYVRRGEVKTATVGGEQEPSAAELARREKLKRER